MNPFTELTPEFEAQIRASIFPELAGILGTISYERTVLLEEINRLRGEVNRITELGQGHIRRAARFEAERRDALLAVTKRIRMDIAKATGGASAEPHQPLTDAQIDSSLDAILRASGSALEHYTMAKTRDGMRAALRAAIAHGMGSEGGAV